VHGDAGHFWRHAHRSHGGSRVRHRESDPYKTGDSTECPVRAAFKLLFPSRQVLAVEVIGQRLRASLQSRSDPQIGNY
jgi:hypothetical protein